MRTPILLVAIVICACAPELPAPDAQREPPLAVELMPDAPVDAAPSVFHVAVRGAAAREAPEAIVMVTGELSDYHLRRIEQEDLPGTLLERLVPVSVLMALLGYAVGNYAAFAAAWLCSLVAGVG